VTKVTLRPDSDGAEKRVTLVGASTAHEALSDDSDSTYCSIGDTTEFDGYQEVGVGEYEPPEGAITKSVVAWARLASDGGWLGVDVSLWHESQMLSVGQFGIAISTPSTYSGEQVAGPLSATAVNQLSVEVRKHDGTLSHLLFYEAYLNVTYVDKPTLAVDAPSETVEVTNRPRVEWTDTLDSDGGPQTRYEVKVFAKEDAEAEGFDAGTATAVAESEIQSGAATTWTPSMVLADGDYRAYVRIAQTVNGTLFWSDWAYESFTLKVALPAVPVLTLTPEDDEGRIRAAVEEGAEGDATTEGFEAQWSHDGKSWTHFRTEDGEGLAEGTSATLYDYEAPNGLEVSYRVRAWHEYEGEQRAWSAWAEKSAAWESADRWLKHPTDPSLNLKVEPYSYPGSTRTARVGNFQPLGRRDPIVVSDTRLARTGSLVLWVESEEDREALDSLLETLTPLLLQMAAQDARKDGWVSVGTVDESPIVDKLAAVDTLVTLELIDSARP
jgi:hypothetical protein